ncbi:MAG: hypothetical protein ACRET8_09500 [Burkholderiales bacterium]
MREITHATLEIAYFDARESLAELPVQVMLDAMGMTLVVPAANGEDAVWRGERRGQGHYVLSTPDQNMQASLHRFADSSILEGFWRNGAERGFWRLHLPEAIPALLRARDPAPGKQPARAAGADQFRKGDPAIAVETRWPQRSSSRSGRVMTTR